MTHITKRLRKRDWDRLTELLGVEGVGYIRMSTSMSDDKGGVHSDMRTSSYGSDSIEIAMKEAPPAPEGTRRVTLAFKDTPTQAGKDMFFGWAIVSREKVEGAWKEHKDLDGDYMTDDVLVDAFKSTFGSPQPFYEGHNLDDRAIKGWVQYMPMTVDLQKGLGLEGRLSGLLACIKVDDADLRDKMATGDLPDLSIEAMVQTEG